jgi:hypothetical protein
MRSMDFLRLLAFLLGLAIVARAVFSAIQTYVLPRSVNDRLSRLVFRAILAVFLILLRQTRTYAQRDRTLAFYIAGAGRHHHGPLRPVVVRSISAARGAAQKQSGVFQPQPPMTAQRSTSSVM